MEDARGDQERRQASWIAPAVVEALQEAVVAFDGDGRVVLANAQAEALFGYPREEFLGLYVERLLPERLHARYRAERERFLGSSGVHTGLHFAIRRRDGSERPVEVDLSVSDAPECLVTAVAGDTAARRRLERQLLEAQKLESIGRLAAGVAHDFNNVLTSVSGYAHLALSRLPPGDPVHEDVRQIVRAVDRAGRLVTQLQAFSRGERLEVQVLDLSRTVREVGRLLEVVLGATIRLDLRLEPRGPGVKANLGALEQALMQLALNARDAMPDGGRLAIETRAENGSAVLSVSDTGSGMDELTRAHAFEPFFTTKDAAESIGLGLTIVYALAERLGGHVALDSAPGAGTTVTLHFPLADAPTAVTGGAGSATIGSVLMVEDEDALRTLVGRILTEEGYTVLTAASGEEALELAAVSGPIDLLVSDVVLGGMTGPELVTKLRARRPDLKVLLMSGYAGVPLGPVDDFLPKPFSPFELARRIRRILRP